MNVDGPVNPDQYLHPRVAHVQRASRFLGRVGIQEDPCDWFLTTLILRPESRPAFDSAKRFLDKTPLLGANKKH
jgi:hypothetical protein